MINRVIDILFILILCSSLEQKESFYTWFEILENDQVQRIEIFPPMDSVTRNSIIIHHHLLFPELVVNDYK